MSAPLSVDPRVAVVSAVLYGYIDGFDVDFVSTSVLLALDADARTRPYIGIVPPVRLQ